MRLAVAVIALLGFLPRPSSGQAPCQVQGVWQLVSATYDDQTAPADWRQIKIITQHYFTFVGEGSRGVKEMKTAADSLQAFRAMSSGGGTYTLKGRTYTEQIQYFANPAYIGLSIPFTCRTEGDRLVQTGTFPVMEGGQKVREIKLEEVWRRIERL